ncbi:MAG TPA: VTT domain-containing protein [Candidatus Saccharimonadales bacterium]|nr:VTT domain-containing protein [Candidatus Saccharimonadales bacterium]
MELVDLFRHGIRFGLSLIAGHQFVALFGLVALEEAGIPLPAPSDIVIMIYGSNRRESLSGLVSVVLICAAASTVGTLIPYVITRKWGQTAAHRVARWIDVEQDQVDKWTTRISERGFSAIFIGRLIPGLRVAMSVVGGTARVPVHEFAAAVFLAGVVYWSFWTGIGAIFGPTVRRLIPERYIQFVVIGIPVVFVGYLIFRYVRGRRRHARKQAAA